MGDPITMAGAIAFYVKCIGIGWSTLFVYWLVVSIVNVTYR